jgi:peptide/nickel transport system substrate-binding protein
MAHCVRWWNTPRVSSVDQLPIGTVTFLFTDIEGSTQLLKQLGGERYRDALEGHQRILREAFAEHGGHEIDTQGDSFFVAFRRAKDAVSAAIACQRRLAEHAWPDGTELRVRMGIHTGEPAVGGERYVGLGVHRAARICAAGHGGQVLVSQTARELLRDDPIPDVSLRDLGEHQLKDLDEPERLYQLVAPGLLENFPALKTAAPAPFEGREGELAEAAVEEMAKRWRRPGRRVLIAATFAAAVVGAAAGVLITQGGGTTAGASIAPNTVGVIDSKSGRVVSEIPVGGAPGDVAAALDAVWVTNANDNTVSRIDPSTNDVRQTIRVGGGPASVAVGGGAIWVANGLDGTVARIDPTTNEVVQTITVGNGPSGVAYGEGAVWVTNSADGTVSKIAPGTGRVRKTVPAVIGASGVAVGFRRIWVASPSTASVVTLDHRSGRVLQRIGVGGEPSAIAVGADAVWVANRADDTVSKIDPQTTTVKDTIQVGRRPEGIAAGPEAVWVANGGDGTLIRLDPSSGGIVKTVPLDNPPRGVALTRQGVYVAVQSTGVEHRGGTLRVLSAFGPESIDPAVAGFTAASVLLVTNDGLVSFRKVGGVEGIQLVPDLAVALPTPAEGGKTYTFQVRPGIHYSNGQLVQPEDFKRAIERQFVIGATEATGFYSGIVGADRCVAAKPCDLDEGIVADRAARTVTFRITEPDADFLAKLALPFAVAVPAGTPARDVGTRPVPATGPYRIAAFEKGKTLRLVRNRRFREWSADAQPQGFPDSISFSWRLGLDTTARVRAVERGAADVKVGDGPPSSKQELEGLAVRYPSQLHVNTLLATIYFFLNTRVSPFDDVRVRRAVNSAFDREAFARLLGREVAPTCQILPPNLPGYRRTCPYLSGGVRGLESARRLVTRSGAAGTQVTVWVISPIAEQGRYLVSVLNSLGFRARLKTVDRPDAYFTMVADSRVRAQAGFGAWQADVPSAAGFIPGLLSCAALGQTNLAQFCDRSIDRQIARAAAAQVQDPAAATTLWQQVEQSLLAQAPIVPAYNRRNVDFVSKRVDNYQYNPQWGVLLDQLWVK